MYLIISQLSSVPGKSVVIEELAVPVNILLPIYLNKLLFVSQKLGNGRPMWLIMILKYLWEYTESLTRGENI